MQSVQLVDTKFIKENTPNCHIRILVTVAHFFLFTA